MDGMMHRDVGQLSWARVRRWYQASLVNRTTCMGLALASSVMLIIVLLVIKLGAGLVQRSVDERLEALAARNAMRLESEIERILIGIDNVSHRPLIARGLAEPVEAKRQVLPFLYEFRHAFPEVDALSLVDMRGQIVVAAATNPLIDSAVQASVWRSGQSALSLQTRRTGTWLHFAYPVFQVQSGEKLGIVAGDLDLSALLARTKLDVETVDHLPLSLAVESADGRSIYRSEQGVVGKLLQVDVPIAGRLARGGVEMRLRAGVSRDAAYAPLYALVAWASLLAVAVLAVVVLLIRKLSVNVLRPLQEMSQHAIEVAGAGPAGLRELPVTRADEIGAMGLAFNEMVYSLRQAYETQEAEVQRRTRELGEAQKRLAGVLAGIDDVVYATDPSFSRLDYVSPAAMQVFGLTPEQCINDKQAMFELVLPEDRAGLIDARCKLEVGVSRGVRYRIRRSDGAIRWIKDRFHLLCDEETGAMHVGGVIRDVTARMEAEASLHLRERALASSSCGVVIADMSQPGLPILYVNEAFQRITGYATDEVVGQNWSLLQGSKGENAVGLAEVRLAIAEGRGCKVVIRDYRKDGEAFWNELQLSPIVDDTGRVTHYIGVQNDITANIMATQALVESEQRLALTIDALHEGVWDWRIGENRFITSPSWAEILGVDPHGLSPQDGFSVFSRYLPASWGKHVQEEFDAYLAGSGNEFYLEHQMQHADGRSIWVANHGRIVERAMDGRPERMVGTIVDITQRIESSQQIIGLMAQLDSIFTLSPDAFIYFNDAGRVTFVNPAFERLTGIQAGESTGLSRVEIRHLLQDRSDPSHPFPWFDAGRHPGDQDGQLMYLLHPTRRVLLVSRRGGEGSAAVVYLRDVTRETEVDRMKSEFLTTAAHELRTPMASIMGFAELLMLREFPPERTKDMLATMHRQARRLTDLINELLDLARIEARAGKDFKISRQHIEPVIRDAIAALNVDGDRSRMQLYLPENLPELDIDPAKMQQAIINVLSNAYKYSPKGGPIDISARRRERDGAAQVAIIVRDHGIGMTADQSARVFERFFRADPSGNIPGTGLGMSLVKEIMDSHGGSVEVDSEVGQGTSVSLWLPVQGSESRSMPEDDEEPGTNAHGELTLWLDQSDTAGPKGLLH